MLDAPQRLLPPLLLLLAAGLLAVACGSSGDDSEPPEQGEIPTATLPSPLPEPLIVGATTVPVQGTTYTVQSGDSPSSIAERFGTTAEAIMEANGITDPTGLYVGQVLVIPGAAAEPDGTPAPTAEPAPTSEPQPEPTVEPEPEPEPTVTPEPPAEGTVYIVQAGDIPETIAAQFGITADALMAANGITDPTSLQIGQELIIPSPPPEATPEP
jgi:LysM repeat protein